MIIKNEDVHILVVDDEPGMRLTLQGILARRGFKVSVAENGEQAVVLAAKNRFNVIIMDIKMAGISGVQAFLRMKENDPDIVVIIMTGYAMDKEIEQVHEEGAYAVLTKPLDMKMLLALIDDSLSSGAPGRKSL